MFSFWFIDCKYVYICVQCQRQVADIIKGKVLVGHALKNDLDVLMLKHGRHSIRDTASYRPYMRVSLHRCALSLLRVNMRPRSNRCVSLLCCSLTGGRAASSSRAR